MQDDTSGSLLLWSKRLAQVRRAKEHLKNAQGKLDELERLLEPCVADVNTAKGWMKTYLDHAKQNAAPEVMQAEKLLCQLAGRDDLETLADQPKVGRSCGGVV